EFLLLKDFQLPPFWRSFARFVSGVSVLRDEPLPSARERPLVKRPTIALNLFADPHERRGVAGEELLEPRPALRQGEIAQVMVVFAKQIERDQCHRGRRRQGSVRMPRSADPARRARSAIASKMNAALELLKSGRLAARIERDDLAVDDRIDLPLPPQLRQR